MIGKLSSDGWVTGNAAKSGEDLSFDVPNDAIVEVHCRCSSPASLSAVTASGELVFLDMGTVLRFRQRLEGFAGVVLNVKGAYAYRANFGGADEAIDPTVMVHQVLAPVNPERMAMKLMMQEYLEKLRIDGLFKDDVEVAELAEDFVDGDLEFDEPDEFGLTAAAEMEEDRQREKAQADALRRREEEEAEEEPPGEQNTAPPGAVAAGSGSPTPNA